MEEFISVLNDILFEELEFIIDKDYGHDYLNNFDLNDFDLAIFNDIWDGLLSELGWKGLIFGIGLLKLLDNASTYFKKEDINYLIRGFDIDNIGGSRKDLLRLSDTLSNYNDSNDNSIFSLDNLSNLNQFFKGCDKESDDLDNFIRIEEDIANLLSAYIFSFDKKIFFIFNNINFIDFIYQLEERHRLSCFLNNLVNINLSKKYFSSLNAFIDTIINFIDKLCDYEFPYYHVNLLNQPGKKQLYIDKDILRDKFLVELLFSNVNLEKYEEINVYIPCCDNINIIHNSMEFIKSRNNKCIINFYGKLNFNNSIFNSTILIMYSFLKNQNIFLSSSKEEGFPFDNFSLENMDFIISDYRPKDIFQDGNFIHEFQNKLNYSSKLVVMINKEQYSNNYVNFIVLNDNLESIITFEDFFILILNSNKSPEIRDKFLLIDYTILDKNHVNNLEQFRKKLLVNTGIFLGNDLNQYIIKSFVNFNHLKDLMEVYTNFSNTNFSKVIIKNDAVKNFYQFKTRKYWGEFYFDSFSNVIENDDIDELVEVDETEDIDELVEVDETEDIEINGIVEEDTFKIHDINFYLENFNLNNLMYDLKRKPYSLVKQRYIGNKKSEIIEEKLDFVPLYSLITFDENELEDKEIESYKIEKYHHYFYVKSENILRDFLLYYLDSDKGKEEYNYFKNGFGFESSDNKYVQSGYTTRCEFIYIRIPLVDIETQKKIIKTHQLNEEHYDLVKKSRDNFKSNILDYEKILKDMEEFNKMEMDTKKGEIVKMRTVKRHMFDGLLWPLSISYLNAVHGTHVSNPNEKLDFYLKLFEFLTAFIDIILISAIPEEEYDNLRHELWKGIAEKRNRDFTFGNWTVLYSKLLNLYDKKNIKPNFSDEFIESLLSKDIYKIMDGAKNIRNEFPGHGTSIHESRAQQLIDDLKLKIDVVYDIFNYFTGFKLFYFVKILDITDDGNYLYEVVSLNGPCDQPIYGKVTFNEPLKKNSLYLNNSRDGNLLKLNENLILFEEFIESYIDKHGQKKERATGRFNLYLFNGFEKKKNHMLMKYKCHQIEIDEIPKNISYDDWKKLM